MPHQARYRCCCALIVLATVVPACCVDAVPDHGARPLTAEQQAFWEGFLREDQLRRAAEDHSVDYDIAEQCFRDGRFADALTAVRAHLAHYPRHQRGLDLQQVLIAVTRGGGVTCTIEDILRDRR